MSAPNAGLGAWWLRYGGALLVAACVVSWLLPLPPWAHFLWNMLVSLGCVHLLALHRKRGGNGGRREP
ncbi:hypothetical protein [Streptomyces sp. NBC_00859]|uniref:hypothetical protein n=1 Tax=Streptomyces sp. NBC_00859 TaxID=2903682 RepID=UPI00386D1DCC|nr:hypothetical protein OG584_23620 [Streptomyces sp. NBC_00859]